VRCLGEAGLRVLVGAKEPIPEAPMADLVLHIHREPPPAGGVPGDHRRDHWLHHLLL
jgi:hypothetical protein